MIVKSNLLTKRERRVLRNYQDRRWGIVIDLVLGALGTAVLMALPLPSLLSEKTDTILLVATLVLLPPICYVNRFLLPRLLIRHMESRELLVQLEESGPVFDFYQQGEQLIRQLPEEQHSKETDLLVSMLCLLRGIERGIADKSNTEAQQELHDIDRLGQSYLTFQRQKIAGQV